MKVEITRRDRHNEKPLLDVSVDDLEAVVASDSVAALNEDISIQGRVRAGDIAGKLSHAKMIYEKIADARIQTTETAIPHRLGVVPLYYHVNVKNRGYAMGAPSVWETKGADSTALYLQADIEAYVDIVVRG